MRSQNTYLNVGDRSHSHSCQILSPSETGFKVSAHSLTNITLSNLIATL